MNAQLHIRMEGETPRTIALAATCTIGRTKGNDLLLEDSRVSRHHALIRLLGGNQYFVMDLGSSNGTFLNGRPVTVPAPLKSGDEIQIGNSRLTFDFPHAGGTDLLHSAVDTSTRTSLNFVFETVSILVVDIRNFTVLSEAIPATELAKLVGAWFREASQAIERHGGTIDKFMGDAVMAYWVKTRGRAERSFVVGPLTVAQELVRLAQTYRATLSAKYHELSFSIGCGIHLGEATLGNVGEVARRDLTAMGDCVNVAFRIESLCKEVARPVLVSQEVKEAAGGAFAFDDLGPQHLKGKTQDIRVFGLSGF